MKKFAVIGMGNFGLSLAMQLEENGCEVIGIDSSKQQVEAVKDCLSHTIIGDATNKEMLASLMMKDFDGAVVSIGQEMAPSILIALYLQEIGMKNIIVRAVNIDHGKILEKIGVSQVIYPETEMAVKLANKLSMKNALDYLPLSEEHGIIEVIPPGSFINKTLKDLEIASRFNCQVIAIKYLQSEDKNDIKMKIPPAAGDVILENAIMVIIGKLSDIEILQKQK